MSLAVVVICITLGMLFNIDNDESILLINKRWIPAIILFIGAVFLSTGYKDFAVVGLFLLFVGSGMSFFNTGENTGVEKWKMFVYMIVLYVVFVYLFSDCL